jgi:hypothetical protein
VRQLAELLDTPEMGAAMGEVAGMTADLVQKGPKVSVPSETLSELRLQQATLRGPEMTRGSANKFNLRASSNRRERVGMRA